MASKDIDFDDLDLDNFGSETLDPGVGGNKQAKDRSALTEVPLSFAKGALSTMTESHNLRKFVSEAMPEGYGTTIQTAAAIGGELKTLYNEAANQLAPAMPFMRRVAGKLSEKQRFLIPKALQEKLNEFSKGTDNQGFIESQEKQDSDTIAGSMAELVQAQMQQNAQEERNTEVREAIRDQVQNKQHLTLAQLMEATRVNTARVDAFNNQVFARYMQKDLELQYRQYFAQRDLLKVALRREQVDNEYLKAIVRNTGLPEFQKLKLSEAAGQSFRDRLLGGVQKSAANYVSTFVQQLGKNARGIVNGALGSLTSGMQMGDSALEMMKMQEDMAADMEELGVKKQSKASTAAHFAGGAVADWMMPFLTGPIRKLMNRSQKTRQMGAKAGMMSEFLAEKMNAWAQSPTDSGGILAPLLWMLKDAVPRFSLDRNIGESPLVSADRPAVFSNLAHRSIVEIIPGWLSRIHRELVVTRTGDDTIEPMTYNLDRGEFSSMKQATSDAARRLFSPSQMRIMRDKMGDVTGGLLGEDGDKIDPKYRKELEAQLLRDAASGQPLSLKRLTDGDNVTPLLSLEAKEALRPILERNFALADGSGTDAEKLLRVSKQFRTLQTYYPNPKDMMSVYRDAGQREILQNLGIIDRQGFMDRANYDAIDKILLGTGKNEYVDENAVEGNARDDLKKFTWTPFGDRDVHSEWTDKVVGKIDRGTEVLRNFDVRKTWEQLSDSAQKNVAKALDMTPQQISEEGAAIYAKLSKDAKRKWRRAMIAALTSDAGKTGRKWFGQGKDLLSRSADKVKGSSPFKFLTERANQMRGAIENSALYTSSQELFRKKRAELEKAWAGKRGFAESISKMSESGKQAVQERLSAIKGSDITLRQIYQNGEAILKNLEPSQVQQLLDVATEAEVAEQSNGTTQRLEPNVPNTPTAPRPVTIVPGPQAATSPLERMAPEHPAGQIDAEQNRTMSEIPGMPDLLDVNNKQLEALVSIHEAILAQGSGGGGEGGSGPKTSWLRGMFGKGLRGATKLSGKLASWYGKYSLGVLKAPFQVGALAVKGAWNFGKGVLGSSGEIVDIYVVGETEVRLTKKKLLKGDYRDAKTKKPVRVVKDIKGPVIDVSAGQDASPVVTDADIAAGFYTLKDGKPSLLRRLGGIAGSVLGTVAGAYGQMFKLPFMMTSGALKLAGWGWRKLTNKKMDVYVIGQADPSTPRLRAVLMDGKNYFTEKGKGVTGIHQLNGQRIFSADKTTLLIGPEDYKAGLVNGRGKALETGLQKILGIGGRLVGGLASAATTAVTGLARGAGRLIGGAWSMMGTAGGGLLKRIGKMFGIKGNLSKATPDELVYKQTQLLEAIHDMLDARLPGKKLRKGSWEDQVSKLKDKLAGKKDDDKGDKKDGLWGKFGDLFKKGKNGLLSMLGLGGDEDEDGDGGGDTTVIAGGGGGGGDGDGKRTPEQKRKDRLARGKQAARRRGKLGALFRAKDAIGGKMGKLPGLGKLKGVRLGGKGAILGSVLASIGLSNMGGFGDKVGNLLDVASMARWAGMLGGTGTGAATTTAAAGGAAAAGGGAAAAGATGAAGATAAAGAGTAAAGTAGAGLAVTVGIPLAIAAAVGYVGYRGYKTFKYGTFTVPRAYRLAQYGIHYSNTSLVEKIIEFEQMCEPHVGTLNGGYDLKSAKNFDINTVYEHFGIDDGWFTNNSDERKAFDLWFNGRFKPVFLAYQAALRTKSAAPGSEPINAVNDLDDASPQTKQEILRQVRGVDASIYSIKAGPDGDELEMGPDEVQEMYLKSERDLKEQLDDSKLGKAMQWSDRLNDALLDATPFGYMGGKWLNEKMKGYRDKVWGRDVNSMDSKQVAALIGDKGAGATAGGSVGYGNVTVSAASSVGLVSLGRLTSAQGLRMRVYGLTELTADRVQAIMALERAVAPKVRIANGKPVLDVNLEQFMTDFGPLFGLDSSDKTARQHWMTWFQYRFCASYLTYLATGAALLGGSDVTNLDARMKPDQKYQAALAMTRAKIADDQTMTVWQVWTSPWDVKAKLNDNPDIAKAPLETLKAGAKDGKLVDEERASGIDARVKDALDRQAGFKPGESDSRSMWQKAKDFVMGNQTQGNLLSRGIEGVRVAGLNAGEAWDRARQGDFSGAATAAMGAVTAVGRYTTGVNVPEPKMSASGKQAEATLIKAALEAGMTNVTELAMFLGQCYTETGGFRLFSEGINYSARRAFELWPRKFGTLANAERIAAQGATAIADFVYGSRMGNTQPGDGSRFRGRGFIQLTGRSNYTSFARASGLDVLNNPEIVAKDPNIAARASLHWWMTRGAGLRQKAAEGDVRAVTILVNGGTNHLEQRRTAFQSYMRKFQSQTPQQYLASLGGAVSNEAGATGDALAVAGGVLGTPFDALAQATTPFGAVAAGLKSAGDGKKADFSDVTATVSTSSSAAQAGGSAPPPSGSPGLGSQLAVAAGPMAASGGSAPAAPVVTPTASRKPGQFGETAGLSSDLQYGYNQVAAQMDASARENTARANAATMDAVTIHREQLEVSKQMAGHLSTLVDYARDAALSREQKPAGEVSDNSRERTMRAAEQLRRDGISGVQRERVQAQAPSGGLSMKRQRYA